MSYYANSDQRDRLIAGLRELAEFLGQNPQVPAPCFTDVLVFPHGETDAEMFAEIDLIAGQLGVTASGHDNPADHYVACRYFGPVQFRAVAIPNAVRHHQDEEAE
jgi:hypothetical protein